jgi:hypothetical protein
MGYCIPRYRFYLASGPRKEHLTKEERKAIESLKEVQGDGPWQEGIRRAVDNPKKQKQLLQELHSQIRDQRQVMIKIIGEDGVRRGREMFHIASNR